MHGPNPRNRRQAFTLVELLVVLTLLLILAAISVAFVPRTQEQQKATRGADQLQGWLLIAKQRALRDGLPTGLRLTLENPSPNIFIARNLQFVQQPELNAWNAGGSVQSDWSTNGRYVYNSLTTAFAAPDYTGGFVTTGTPDVYPVQPGDYLEAPLNTPPHQIAGVEYWNQPGLPPPPRLRLACDLTTDVGGTAGLSTSYRIWRQPRLLQGEPPLQLPQDVVIDVSTNAAGVLQYSQNVPVRSINYPTPTGTPTTINVAEIIFGPKGEVIGKGSGNDKVILWLRDVTQDSPTLGNPVLLTINIRTGMTAVQPVDLNPSSPSPYTFTRDGQASGL